MNNILTALGVQNKEDVVSNLLVYCINASPEFARGFAAAMAQTESVSYDKISAFSRKQVPDTGVPDIVLIASDKDGCDIFIIENKLKAEEGKDQTISYARPECVDSLRHSLRRHITAAPYRNPVYVFLTLFPDQKPDCDQFHHVTYQALLATLGTSFADKNPLVSQLWGDFAEILSAFYVAGETNPDDVVVGHLCQDEGLDGSFLYFGNIIRNTAYSAGLGHEEVCRRSWSGRKCYLATITKEDWHLDDGGRCLPYTIHIEPQFDCLYHRFPIFVHYELYPYETEKDAKRDHPKHQIEHYNTLREQFKAYMKLNAPAGFDVRGGWNQIGRTEIRLDDTTTLQEFQAKLQACVAELQTVIDGFSGLK